MKMFGVACKEVAELVASDRLRERSWRLRMQVRLHLLTCALCRRYVAQIRALGEQARRLADSVSPSAERVEKLQEDILGKLGLDDEEPPPHPRS